MWKIRYVQMEDKAFWFRLDRHLSEPEFARKVQEKRGYLLLADDEPAGLLRYNLFWDNTPFCTMLFVDWAQQNKGYGSELMAHWEADMRRQGYRLLLTSTQADERAQHFYRKLGYRDCGCLLLEESGAAQPMELFLCKPV